jgi:hypothetical protein
MKNFLSLLGAVAVIAVIVTRCDNKAQTTFKDLKMGKRDSTRTIGAFMGYQFKTKHWGDMIRIHYDTIAYVPKPDSANLRRELTRVTWYSVTVPVQVDSAFAAAFHVPLRDSAGKPNVVRFQMDLAPKYVRDTVSDLDSALRYLDQFVVKDSITKK